MSIRTSAIVTVLFLSVGCAEEQELVVDVDDAHIDLELDVGLGEIRVQRG